MPGGTDLADIFPFVIAAGVLLGLLALAVTVISIEEAWRHRRIRKHLHH